MRPQRSSSLSGLAQADAAHPVVALLPGVVDPFYFTMHRGAERAAKEENVELPVPGSQSVEHQ
ncbi:MAG: hypothetical protein CBARDCOR_2086 [uncultured Caballeronia sp.]|nr:MAG: hypothetical protein CBARDCOR_2086 [uncultured Caballeronia sp.]